MLQSSRQFVAEHVDLRRTSLTEQMTTTFHANMCTCFAYIMSAVFSIFYKGKDQTNSPAQLFCNVPVYKQNWNHKVVEGKFIKNNAFSSLLRKDMIKDKFFLDKLKIVKERWENPFLTSIFQDTQKKQVLMVKAYFKKIMCCRCSAKFWIILERRHKSKAGGES